MAYISPALTAIAAAAKKAAIAMSRDFNELEHLQSSVHGDGMFAVRSYDKAERIIKEELAKLKPTYPVVCKKADSLPADGNCFLVAPIDGFANFSHGNGCFAISIAMMENNTVIDAVIYNPVFDELFFAEKGCGAFKEGFRNHERIRVAGNKNIARALIGCDAEINNLQKALELSKTTTVKGAVALDLAYLAAGKLDVVISSEAPSWTIAAGMLLVKEAGGYIFTIGETDVRSENLPKVLFGGNLFATNEYLRQKVADMMAK